MVVGQAFRAAGYDLEERPIQWAGGKYRFNKPQPDGHTTSIEFQYLAYQDTEWSSGQPSRFRVMLYRTLDGTAKDLSALVVEDFGVAILPSARHWWQHPNREPAALGKALGEAGSLAIAYGMPWLEGSLQPPDRTG
jgi:hypothetical protein